MSFCMSFFIDLPVSIYDQLILIRESNDTVIESVYSILFIVIDIISITLVMVNLS